MYLKCNSYRRVPNSRNYVKKIIADVLKNVKAIFTAKASTANVWRFSSFGVVQSNLRNILGLEKFGNLIFGSKC